VNDRELLEMAAKAMHLPENFSNAAYMSGWYSNWNPLTDDGDALRLAVKLSFLCDFCRAASVSKSGEYERLHADWVSEPVEGDKMAATRRAIVRAAAEIGRSMQ
jgi:hypothetical protein